MVDAKNQYLIKQVQHRSLYSIFNDKREKERTGVIAFGSVGTCVTLRRGIGKIWFKNVVKLKGYHASSRRGSLSTYQLQHWIWNCSDVYKQETFWERIWTSKFLSPPLIRRPATPRTWSPPTLVLHQIKGETFHPSCIGETARCCSGARPWKVYSVCESVDFWARLRPLENANDCGASSTSPQTPNNIWGTRYDRTENIAPTASRPAEFVPALGSATFGDVLGYRSDFETGSPSRRLFMRDERTKWRFARAV